MSTKNILYFLSGIFVTLIVAGITIFFVFFGTFGNDNDVNESDWKDDWANVNNNDILQFRKFKPSSNVYIIHNFSNSNMVLRQTLDLIHSVKEVNADSSIYFRFLWNDKYNHPWRVEYINQKYVDSIATLLQVDLVYPPKKGFRYLIDKIYLYPAMQKKHLIPFKITEGKENNNVIYLYTESVKGFDFFLWKDLEGFTKDIVQKRSGKNKFILINTLDSKEIAKIEWFGDGYQIKIPPIGILSK